MLSLVIVGAILAGAFAFLSATRMPVRFRNLDEQREIYNVARWAANELNTEPSRQRLRYSLSLWAYSAKFNWLGSIPVEELAILGSFIDRTIDGKGPPLNLPPEYDDTRPEVLRRFKKRMEAEGLWPDSQS
jgi:hypothetical protein